MQIQTNNQTNNDNDNASGKTRKLKQKTLNKKSAKNTNKATKILEINTKISSSQRRKKTAHSKNFYCFFHVC